MENYRLAIDLETGYSSNRQLKTKGCFTPETIRKNHFKAAAPL